MSRIDRHRSLLDRLDQQVGDLQREREIVRGRLESAERLYQAEFGEVYTSVRSIPIDIPKEIEPLPEREGPLTDLGWGEAIERVIEEAGRPLHVKDIWNLLTEGGFRTEASDPKRSIVAIVIRNPGVFVRVAPNTYAIERLLAQELEGAVDRFSQLDAPEGVEPV